MEETKTFGIIGGSNLLKSSYFKHLKVKNIHTEYGDIIIYIGNNFIFCQRHQSEPNKEYIPPHLINTKAIIKAMENFKVKKIIAFCSVGSLKQNISVGQIVIPDDYFNIWKIINFYDDNRGHFVPNLNNDLRKEIIQLFYLNDIKDILITATYVQTFGPRFETKSEIKFLSTVGDIVGMTGANEAILAQEINIEYVMICMVDNMGNGLQELSYEKFKENIVKNENKMENILNILIKNISKENN